jgi:predicted RecA/RadA family phage recombinase
MASNILDMNGAHTVKYTTTGAVTVGTLLLVSATPMVAMEAATGSGQVIECAVGCEASLAKKAAASTNWAAFGRVYYVTTGGVNKLTGGAAAGKLIGYGPALTATGATSGRVRLLAGPALLGTTS